MIAEISPVLLEPTIAPKYAVWYGSVITGPAAVSHPVG